MFGVSGSEAFLTYPIALAPNFTLGPTTKSFTSKESTKFLSSSATSSSSVPRTPLICSTVRVTSISFIPFTASSIAPMMFAAF